MTITFFKNAEPKHNLHTKFQISVHTVTEVLRANFKCQAPFTKILYSECAILYYDKEANVG